MSLQRFLKKSYQMYKSKQHPNSHKKRKQFSKAWKNKYPCWAKIKIFKWVKRI